MPFKPVSSEKLSHAVVRQVEQLILRGILRPGERLPAERELAKRLDVSRPSLRDAIAQLEQSGLLTAKPGAGVYVADVLGGAFSPPLIELFARHDEAVFDYLSFRRDMEGLAAERAARLASDTDLKDNKIFYNLLGFIFLFMSFSNVISTIPSGGRFLYLANLLATILIILIFQNYPTSKSLKTLSLFASPFLIFFIVIALRLSLYSISMMTIFGNPLTTILTFGDNLSINDIIKGF